jgi:nuclear GTP-binding protein
MGRKRKLDETNSEPAGTAENASNKEDAESGDEEFEGFESDDDDDSIVNLEISDEESGEE